MDLCALSPYVHPIDIRIPLFAASQTGAKDLVFDREKEREIFRPDSETLSLTYRDALFTGVRARRGIARYWHNMCAYVCVSSVFPICARQTHGVFSSL